MKSQETSGVEHIERAMAKNFLMILNEKKLTQKKISEDTDISQTKISNWIRGKSDIKFSELYKLCEYLNIKIEDLNETPKKNSKPIHNLIKSHKKLTESPSDEAFDKYFGNYHCYFLPTFEGDSQKRIYSELILSEENGKAHANLIIHLPNRKKDKTYEGVMSINKELDAIYCILQGNQTGEWSFLALKYIPLNEISIDYLGGIAAVVTTSAGGKFRPTMHKMLISRSKLDDDALSTLLPFLLLYGDYIEIEVEKFENVVSFFSKNKNCDVVKFLESIKERYATTTMYRFRKTVVTESDLDRALVLKCLSVLTENSTARPYSKIDDTSSELILNLLK